jgi:hypothetical protein
MPEQNKDTGNVLRKSYQHTVVPLGDCYQPIPKGNIPKTFLPPKGGTGACVVEMKTVSIKTEKI